MNAERFEGLLQQLLDGELAPAEGEELATELRSSPARRRELRQHLVLWELWAQQQAPERSAEAFLAACGTRLRAERQEDRFVAEVEQRIRADRVQASAGAEDTQAAAARGGLFHWWRALQQPSGALWTAVSAIAIVAVVWLALPGRATATVTLRGEAVCTACTLHETHEHLPAVRVHHGGRTEIYYVQSDPMDILRIGDYCVAPVPLVATGRMHTENGRRLFEAQSVAGTNDGAQPPAKSSEPILFPF